MNLNELKKEIPYKWRVQSANQYGASCVAYIDARDVQDLLDEVIGADKWQCKYSEHKGNLFCSIGVNMGDFWIWKEDCGTESNIEKQKGESSDAFKRSAVMWGVGRFLYHKPIVKLPVKERNGKFVPFSTKTNKFITDSDSITKWCNSLIGEVENKKQITETIKEVLPTNLVDRLIQNQ